MRTTVNIDDGLLERAKQLALKQGHSLGQVFEEALRSILYPSREKKRSSRTRLKTFCGNGVLPGVDLDSNASLTDLMEDR